MSRTCRQKSKKIVLLSIFAATTATVAYSMYVTMVAASKRYDKDANTMIQQVQMTNSNVTSVTYSLSNNYSTTISSTIRNGKHFWNLSVEERIKFQQNQVDRFCQNYKFDIKYTLPPSPYQDLILSRHLLIDDHTKTLFCFVPKVGCTNLKLALFYAQGFIAREDLQKNRDDIDQNKLEECILLTSLMSRKKHERIEVMKKSNFKFIMYRNPLERLLSAYRSKVGRYPLVGLQKDVPHYNWLRRRIFAHTHPLEYKHWILHGGQPMVNISFSEFIDYWLVYDLSNDEHFRTIFSLCEPCRVYYDYYGNFKTFQRDAILFLNQIGSKSDVLRSGYYQEGGSVPTTLLLNHYYGTISLYQKLAVIRKISLDLDFYYHVFPTEDGIHKQILGIEHDIPKPVPFS